MRRMLPSLALLLMLVAAAGTAGAAGLERSSVPAEAYAAAPPVSQASYAQSPAAAIREWTDWRARLTIPVWVPGVTGTFAESESTGGGPEEEIFETDGSLVFALVGRGEFRRGRWGLQADGFVATLSQDLTFTPTNDKVISGEITGVLIRGDVNYRLGECWFRVAGRTTRLRASVYAGLRYYNLRINVSQVLGSSVTEDERTEWVDPIVGLRLAWDVSRKISFGFEGDLGGFSIGSDLATWASLFVEWRPNRWFHVGLAYSVLDFERTDTEGGETETWDLTLHGPALAIGFRF